MLSSPIEARDRVTHCRHSVFQGGVSECSCQIDDVSKEEYATLKAIAEEAGRRSLEAQANLDAHIRKHSCDRNREGLHSYAGGGRDVFTTFRLVILDAH